MDLLVTMASLAGATLPVDRSMDGVDLSPVLLGTGTLAPRTVFWRAGKGRVARRGPWKLLVQGQKAQLFNLDDDLGETKDLVQAHPQITAELRKALETWEAEVSQGVTRISG
jgi:arylsulfatase A-like enzyme